MHRLELTRTPDKGGKPVGGDPIPRIPYRMATLPNGLTLVVHEDHRNPLVATQLRFNVGSKDEPAGRTGFAHLFEHLMFKASAHRSGNWHRMLQSMGGSGVNGTTNLDRTNYYQTVPTAALDQLLWMESDRMGHLLGGIDAQSLADEILVVKNEKRQREGAPYGGILEAILTTLYPREHPYGHTVLGSFEDLDNATLETAADWHGRWYGASNAVLVIAGDISFDGALAKVEHWFGAMPTGVPLHHPEQWLPAPAETKRVALSDRVPYACHCMIWSCPRAIDPDSALLAVIAQILGDGAHSRLMRRLVDQDQLCLGLSVSYDARLVCSEFHIIATLAPGVEHSAVEAVLAEELDLFRREGPTQAELDRVRRAGRDAVLSLLDNLERVADTLADGTIAFGRPDGMADSMTYAEQADIEAFRAVAERWLSRPAMVLDVRPFEAVAATSDAAIRTSAPPMAEVHAPPFPKVERASLPNGLRIQLARRPGMRTAAFSLLFDNGMAGDPVGLEGLSSTALDLLNAGTVRHDKTRIGELFTDLSIQYGAHVGLDEASLTMKTLGRHVGPAMSLMAELLLEAVYPADEVQQSLARQIAAANGRAMDPQLSAAYAVNRLINGAGHPYGRPSSGTARSLQAIDRDLLIARHAAWLDPARATLILVGDFSIEEVTAFARAAFVGWTSLSAERVVTDGPFAPEPGRYLIARAPEAQSTLHIAMASPHIAVDDQALDVFNSLFGGTFASRLNANLRERRGWTYGAHSSFSIGLRHGAFHITTQVQADRTRDAIAEIEKELRGLSRDRPISRDEIEEARRGLLVGLPSRWAGNGRVLNALANRLVYNLPDDHEDQIEARIRAVSAADLDAVVGLLGDPENYSWVVAGDPAQLGDEPFIAIDDEGRRI